MRRCSRCKRELPIESFGKNKQGPNGRHWWCRECAAASSRVSAERRGGHALLRRMNKYSLTKEEVEAYLQIPACQICNKPFASDSHVHFDHCHQHGHVRGVLCGVCNRLLAGTAGECIVRNERANDYLLRDMEVRLESARAG